MHCLFFFNDTATTEIYTLSLHDALPIWFVAQLGCAESWTATPSGFCPRRKMPRSVFVWVVQSTAGSRKFAEKRSEEHTSELQSQSNLVCRLLLEKKNKLFDCARPMSTVH